MSGTNYFDLLYVYMYIYVLVYITDQFIVNSVN